jgi:hypothetical protein
LQYEGEDSSAVLAKILAGEAAEETKREKPGKHIDKPKAGFAPNE